MRPVPRSLMGSRTGPVQLYIIYRNAHNRGGVEYRKHHYNGAIVNDRINCKLFEYYKKR